MARAFRIIFLPLASSSVIIKLRTPYTSGSPSSSCSPWQLIDPQVPGQVVHTHVATCLFLVSIQSHKQITLSNLHPPVSAIRPFFLITNKTFYGNNNNMIDLASSAGWERCSALLAIALLT